VNVCDLTVVFEDWDVQKRGGLMGKLVQSGSRTSMSKHEKKRKDGHAYF
jgi:hypothetical protein